MDFAVFILEKIKKSKRDTVVLGVNTYELLCPSLPRKRIIHSPMGAPIFIHVDKVQLTTFLKEKYRLLDVSRDTEKIKKSLNYN